MCSLIINPVDSTKNQRRTWSQCRLKLLFLAGCHVDLYLFVVYQGCLIRESCTTGLMPKAVKLVLSVNGKLCVFVFTCVISWPLCSQLITEGLLPWLSHFSSIGSPSFIVLTVPLCTEAVRDLFIGWKKKEKFSISKINLLTFICFFNAEINYVVKLLLTQANDCEMQAAKSRAVTIDFWNTIFSMNVCDCRLVSEYFSQVISSEVWMCIMVWIMRPQLYNP